LYRCLGYSAASAVAPAPEPVTVLYAGLINGDLVTVFNQTESFQHRTRCWAMVVHRQPDGTFVEQPTRYSAPATPGNAGLVDNSLGPAMAAANVAQDAAGAVTVTVTDDEHRSLRFALAAPQRPSDSYSWKPLSSAASGPAVGK
jgi:hypothetical protein